MTLFKGERRQLSKPIKALEVSATQSLIANNVIISIHFGFARRNGKLFQHFFK